jgi:hypothetical protein
MHQASDGLAAEIHKRPRLSQHHLLAPYFADAYFSLALSSVKADRMNPGEVIQTTEADIMAIMGISLTGVTQPDNKLHMI